MSKSSQQVNQRWNNLTAIFSVLAWPLPPILLCLQNSTIGWITFSDEAAVAAYNGGRGLTSPAATEEPRRKIRGIEVGWSFNAF